MSPSELRPMAADECHTGQTFSDTALAKGQQPQGTSHERRALGEDLRLCRCYFRVTASPADTTRAVVVVPGKYQRQLPAEVAVTLVLSCPVSPVFTVLTVL